MTPPESLAAVPRIAEQSGGIGDRLARFGGLAAWPSALAGFSVPSAPEQIRALLAELLDAATVRYLYYGHGNGVMLVHSATAPGAILRTIPALDTELWAPSLAAAWAASSALTAVYAPAEPARPEQLPQPPGAGQSRAEIARDSFVRAVEHGDEHVIKFADTAVEVFARTGNPDAIARSPPRGTIDRALTGGLVLMRFQGVGWRISMGQWGPGALASQRSPVSRVACSASASAT